MSQYIDKSALVAGIDSWRDEIIKSISGIPLTGRDRADAAFEYEILGEVKDFLNFFVKEIDLEKEITRVSKNEYFDFTDWKSIARHFFELGLQVNNPITAADRGMAEEIIINLKRVENDYHIDLTREMVWLRNKTNKL